MATKQTTIKGLPVFRANVQDEECGMLRVSLVEDPAVKTNFLAFENIDIEEAKAKPTVQRYAIQDEEKRLVFGVIMRADVPILRYDDQHGYYWIVFPAETVRDMAEKYLVQGKQNNVDLAHDGEDIKGVHLVQWFIKDSKAGINPEGFEDIEDGSLFGEYHVLNDEAWAGIKDGSFKGFSIEVVTIDTPETEVVSTEKMTNTNKTKMQTIMDKVKDLLSQALEATNEAAETFGSVATDNGTLRWEGDEALKEGDAVKLIAQDGSEEAAPDGVYNTENQAITVADGKVASIEAIEAEAEPEAEQAEEAAEPEKNYGRIGTDRGELLWEGEEDLKAGDLVYIEDENGELVAAPDGDYKTEDGKTIRVAEGAVAEILDPEAEVEAEPEESPRDAFSAVRFKFEASYDDKYRAIDAAIAEALGHHDFYIQTAGDDFAVATIWDEEAGEHSVRYSVSWEGDKASVADPVDVKLEWVPLDFVSPFEKDLAAELETVKEELAALKATPAGESAHQAFENAEAKGKLANVYRILR